MAGIFISYRRDDTAAYAGRIYDCLSSHFGAEQVFMDVDDIKLGEDFVQVLEQMEKDCSALIVVIGRTWLTVCSPKGEARLFDPQDFVRSEIAAGLRNKIRLFPVLVGGASMPQSQELPDDLAALSRVQALPIHDEFFHRDVDELIVALKQVVSVATPAADFDGTWRGSVKYSWGDSHEEIFRFETDEEELLGTASYLGVPRAIQEGKVSGAKITFLTKSITMLGDKTYEEKHQYTGKLANGQMKFRLLTETGYDSRVPENFFASRDATNT